jgi:hypothetical protein
MRQLRLALSYALSAARLSHASEWSQCGVGVALSADHAGGLSEDGFRGAVGAASLVDGVPTTRIFAPAWGNSSLTGDTQVAYFGQASAFSPAIVMGLGG